MQCVAVGSTAAQLTSDGIGTEIAIRQAKVLETVGGYDLVVANLLSYFSKVHCGARIGFRALRGVVLHGPPGSGKSHLSEALVAAFAPRETKQLVTQQFLDVAAALSGAQRSLATFQASLAMLTQRARHLARGSDLLIVVFERAEALLSLEEEDEHVSLPPCDPRAVLAEMLVAELRVWACEGLPAAALVLWASAAPVPSSLCVAALAGHLTLPTPLGCGQRLAVLHACARQLPLGEEKAKVLKHAAAATSGFLPCDLAALCRAAALAAVRRTVGGAGKIDAHRVQITADDFAAARQKVDPTPMRNATVAARPKARAMMALATGVVGGLAAAVGQCAAVRALRSSVVAPFVHLVAEEKAEGAGMATGVREPPIGVLLVGAPGVGKTHLSVQLASELQAHVFAAVPADLLASRVGEAEKRVARLFAAARRCAPSVVVLEDLDALAPTLDSEVALAASIPKEPEEGCETRVALVLRRELDTLRLRRAAHARLRSGGARYPLASEALVIIVATASDHCRVAHWLLAPHRISMVLDLEPQLAPAEAAELLRQHLKGDQDLASADLEAVALELCADGISGRGAVVAALCRAAAVHAVRRVVGGGSAEQGTASSSSWAQHIRGNPGARGLSFQERL